MGDWKSVGVRQTRYEFLGYVCDAPGLWRCVDLSTWNRVGALYRSKEELLTDLDRYVEANWTGGR